MPSTIFVGTLFLSGISLVGCNFFAPARQDKNAPEEISDNRAYTNSSQSTIASEPLLENVHEDRIAAVASEPPLSSGQPIAVNPRQAATPAPRPEIGASFVEATAPKLEISATNKAGSIKELCEEIGRKLGSVSLADCLDQEFQITDGLSVEGRPLALREYPELSSRKPLGRVLLIGGIHGDEYSSVSIVFKWMEILSQHHSGIFHWQFIPVSNPDGLLREISQRQNAHGVDLNRNFPSRDWDDLALNYWQEKTEGDLRRYPGPTAGSEPEVIWLVKHIQEFQPDVIISVHAPFHLVDYDGPPQAPERLGDLQLSKLGVYPGSLGNYAGIDMDMPVVTIELPYAGIMPSDLQISRMWTDLVAWLVKERSKGP